MSGSEIPETSPSPAAVYDERFVPALFGPWGAKICDHAGIAAGHAVLDVACGTGALTLVAARRAGAGGRVTGLDPNPEMLAVARSKTSTVHWQAGRAEELPFPDESFDRVVSQFGCMFFEQPAQALREMTRVLRPEGSLVVAVCDAVDHSPGYAVLIELLHRLFGPGIADAFRAPFVLGDRDRLRSLASEAGIKDLEIQRLHGTVKFASVEALVSTERACAWTLGGLLDEEQFGQLMAAAEESLEPFTTPDGTVEFTMPALCLRAHKPAG